MTYEAPDLSQTPTDDLCQLMMACAMSPDPSDKQFAKACRDELARRKPERKAQGSASKEPTNE